MMDAPTTISGDQAFAYGAIAAGISMVTSYPGSPSSETVESIIPKAREHSIYVEWSSNERVALEMAIGASIAGRRALVCAKSVGMNVMLDTLMALNLTPVHGGLVILLGDDPGGYGSQNDQDTRPLAAMLEMPMLEPATPSEAYDMMVNSFQLSERFNIPFIIRETRAFAQQAGKFEMNHEVKQQVNYGLNSDSLRFVPVPKNVVSKHRELHARVEEIRNWFDSSPYNTTKGAGRKGVVAAGFAYSKLIDVIGPSLENEISLLKLGVIYPLPHGVVLKFLQSCDEVLVLEENEPYIEKLLKAFAHEQKCQTKIIGKVNGTVSREGELFRWQIQAALDRFISDFQPYHHFLQENEDSEKPRQKRFCNSCRYDEVLDLLEITAAEINQKLVFVGDPGCLVTVADRLQAKYAIGSAIAVADGMSKTDIREKPVALVGDSGFFHSTLPALFNAIHNRSDILIVILDNGTTLTSGAQPHPGVPKNALNEPAPQTDISKIAKACGIGYVESVDLDDEQVRLQLTIKDALEQQSLAMLIIKISEKE